MDGGLEGAMIVAYLAIVGALAGVASAISFGGVPGRDSWKAMYIELWFFCALAGGGAGALLGVLVRP